MKCFRLSIMVVCICFLAACLSAQSVSAEMTEAQMMEAWKGIPDPNQWMPTWKEITEHKAVTDDPRPIMKDWPIMERIPKEMRDMLTFDVEEMKQTWVELVGFRSPDIVGKISPEVKPGKYTYQDVANNPGLKELMIPYWAEHIFKPAGPPFAGNIPDFEIIPTMQYYWALPVARKTKENLGKTKLDSDGFYVDGTWHGGFPFPKPNGPHKAQQIIYNDNLGRLTNFGWGTNCWYRSVLIGYDSKLNVDNDGFIHVKRLGLQGRAIAPPFGFYDQRAEKMGEWDLFSMSWDAPRDQAGTVMLQTKYIDPDKVTLSQMYLSSMRRVKTMSGSDTQDPLGGQDTIADDANPKYSKNMYRWKFKLLAEREYLMPAPTIDGAEYLTSPEKGAAFKNFRFQRRPIYVIELTQTDPNYVYSKKIMYIDAELFCNYFSENYDQQGRLYRAQNYLYCFYESAGMLDFYAIPNLARDHIDVHSNVTVAYDFPANFSRSDLSLRGSIKGK